MAPDITYPFKVAADPGTDLWKKPPSTDDRNAPVRTHTTAPLTRFVSASVTFSTAYIVQFDQAGLVLNLTHAESGGRKWIKSGVEFFNDQPRLSVVCCDNWSDWSVAPVDSAVREAVHQGKETVTILFERDGTTLWVYHVDGQGSKVPLREIAWVFGDKGGEGWQVEVGAVVARPNKEVKGPLEATFHALDVKVE